MMLRICLLPTFVVHVTWALHLGCRILITVYEIKSPRHTLSDQALCIRNTFYLSNAYVSGQRVY